MQTGCASVTKRGDPLGSTRRHAAGGSTSCLAEPAVSHRVAGYLQRPQCAAARMRPETSDRYLRLDHHLDIQQYYHCLTDAASVASTCAIRWCDA